MGTVLTVIESIRLGSAQSGAAAHTVPQAGTANGPPTVRWDGPFGLDSAAGH
ncbi:hypothetical protein [Promicromonospora sp. NPDC050880]|uniref:hypothetical protein n=1 Tax=Promicromonospora sp. NPDC050880 TaxID=3364406 RepID=UPI0037A3F8D6